MDSEALAQLQQRTAELERRLKTFQLAAVLAALSLIAFACASLPNPPDRVAEPGNVLRVRGIIIEDEAGRERILIGAPIPAATHRVRTDPVRVREAWAARMGGDRYMGWYEGYRHSMHGILVLDENGYDRIMIGDSVPDPNIGKRIAPSTGIIINDETGFERSGYGLLKPGGVGRVVLGLDSDDGREGVVLALSDDGFSGLMVRDGRGELLLGSAPAEHVVSGLREPFLGLLLRRGREIRYQINGAVER
jgi:hypothetical protein